VAVVVTARSWLACLPAGSWLCCALFGCSGGPARPAPEVDCSVEDDYDFMILQPMEGTTAPWFSYGDPTPGSISTVALQPIPGGRCGSTTALVLTSRGHTDWGAGFGEYQTAMAPVDASGYDGISFWARAGGFGTSSGFLLSVSDVNTSVTGMVCVEPMTEDVVGGAYTYNEAGMIVPLGGRLPAATDCGNGYQRAVFAQRDWYLHRIPFGAFLQTPNPSRNPTGIERSALYQFTIQIPKDSNIELWIDDLGLYRDSTSGAAAPTQAAP
jgi:hypothetical protein